MDLVTPHSPGRPAWPHLKHRLSSPETTVKRHYAGPQSVACALSIGIILLLLIHSFTRCAMLYSCALPAAIVIEHLTKEWKDRWCLLPEPSARGTLGYKGKL